MDGSQEALLDFYRSNLFRAEELIRVSTTSKDLDSNDPPSNPLKAVQFSALSLALVDCELRKAYGDFCGLISTHPQTAISRFKDFISTSIAWQKTASTYIRASDLHCDEKRVGSVAEHVNKQLERRRQRRKYSIDSKDDRYRLIESHLTWADVCSMLSASNDYLWSPFEVARSALDMIMQQMEGAGSNENGPRDASGKFLGNCRDGSLNDDNPSARDFRHPRCPPDTGAPEPQPDFITAGDRLLMDNLSGERYSWTAGDQAYSDGACTTQQDPKLRAKRATSRPFISPLINKGSSRAECAQKDKPAIKDPRLEKLDEAMTSTIMSEILDNASQITWDDIAGLEHAKNIIKETVVWPMLRPDIFTGIRGPPKGILLFGPPGTGKSLIGKFIASQCKATFFNISSSSLTSKWVGDGEKMVRTLFTVAKVLQPSVIFIDEVDSLLAQRSDSEIETTRRIKTELLIQFDGCSTRSEDRVLVIGATNRPEEIDEAARRRFRKKLYIPLPESHARAQIITNLLSQQKHILVEEDIQELVSLTEGYSGYDVDGLVREAALGPIREISDICSINASELRAIQKSDFIEALTQIKASVSGRDLGMYLKFNEKYGSASK